MRGEVKWYAETIVKAHMNLRFTTLWTDQLADSQTPRATKTEEIF
jgi:hypothetical protein